MKKEYIASQVAKILAVDSEFLRYSVEVDPDVAEEFLSKAEEYSDMLKMGRMMQKINRIIPKMNFGGDNPNNDAHTHTVKIGNECSRVIYIILKKHYLKSINIEKLCSDIEAIGQDHGADEVSFVNNESDFCAQVRLWWDWK